MNNISITKDLKDKNIRAKLKIQKEILLKEQAKRKKQEKINKILKDLDKIKLKDIPKSQSPFCTEGAQGQRQKQHRSHRRERSQTKNYDKLQVDKLKIVKIDFEMKKARSVTIEPKKREKDRNLRSIRRMINKMDLVGKDVVKQFISMLEK